MTDSGRHRTQATTLQSLAAGVTPGEVAYHEFLRVPDMSLGFYTLPAGSTDPQHPHGEDEVYHVIAGKGILRVEGEDIPVAPGSIVYVPKLAAHRFHSITADLHVLVYFAPAEGSPDDR